VADNDARGTRRSISLEMTEPVRFTASLHEEAYDADPDTKIPPSRLLTFGYSASGDVTAEVIYAHSGNPEDYDLLRKNGISVKGKIALVRYSNPTAIAASRRSPRSVKAPPLCSFIPIPRKMATRKEKFSPMARGPESHIQRGASLTITSVPAIPPRPVGHRSGAKHIAPKMRARSRKFPALPPLVARTPSRFWKI